MYFQTLVSTAFIAAMSVSAAPAPAPASSNAKSMMATDSSTWTVQSFLRTCYPDDTKCSYSFTLQTDTQTPCTYDVTGAPASRTSYNNVACGSYVVSSNWSGQFGEDAGFSTIAITDRSLIIYAAYTDKQLVNGQVVQPDQSYAPQTVP